MHATMASQLCGTHAQAIDDLRQAAYLQAMAALTRDRSARVPTALLVPLVPQRLAASTGQWQHLQRASVPPRCLPRTPRTLTPKF